jgi:hypothetical protein
VIFNKIAGMVVFENQNVEIGKCENVEIGIEAGLDKHLFGNLSFSDK